MIAQAIPASRQRIWSQLVARAWTDEAFKKCLLVDPGTILAENGIDLPANLKPIVIESDANLDFEEMAAVGEFILPPAPADELTDEELFGNSASYCFSGDCGRCGCGCRRCGRCD